MKKPVHIPRTAKEATVQGHKKISKQLKAALHIFQIIRPLPTQARSAPARLRPDFSFLLTVLQFC
jgi:hypothetical protein